jgi:hypothetical protein
MRATPQQQAERGLEAVERAGDPHAGPLPHQRSQSVPLEARVHDGGLGVQVEQLAQPCEQRHEHRQQRRRHVHRQ